MDARTAQLWSRHHNAIFRVLQRYAAQITWMCRPEERPQGKSLPTIQQASGFLVADSMHAYWVTAGHVIQGLKAQYDQDLAFKPRLQDDAGDLPASAHMVPLPIADGRMLLLDDSTAGIDIGLVKLGGMECSLIAKGRSRWIPPNRLVRSAHAFDMFAMVGSPAYTRQHQVTRIEGGGIAHTQYDVGLVPLQIIREPVSMDGPFRFVTGNFGDLSAKLKVDATNLVGFSGSPIFGIRLSARRFQWKLVGIQYAQQEAIGGARVIVASSVTHMVRMIMQHTGQLPAA